MARIGLVAGAGELPAVFAKEAKRKGDEVIAFGLKGITAPKLEALVDKMHWFEWGQLQKAIFTGLTERVKSVVWLGKVDKSVILKDEKKLDAISQNIYGNLRDKTDSSIMKGISAVLDKVGIEVLEVTSYLSGLMPSAGVLTDRKPTAAEEKDIEKGKEIARELAKFDIGQTICIKDGCVLALEGPEGTDAAIKRAGELSGGGFAVIKMARPNQDMRFDVPLVGPATLNALISAKGTLLAMEKSKTLLIDRDEVISLANRSGISVIII
jgi:DUF1009 family protein